MAKNKNNNLDILLNCFFCNNHFSQKDFLMIEEQDQKTILHVTCPKCNTSAIIFVSATAGGIVSLGMATDLDRMEVKEMFHGKTIEANDVLEAYDLIFKKDAKITEILNV